MHHSDIKTTFADRGFVILRDVIDSETVEQGRAEAARAIEHATHSPSDIFTNYYMVHRPDQGVLYDIFQRYPWFDTLTRHRAVVEAIQSVFSPNFYLYENSLIYKTNQENNAVPWHQDFMDRKHEPTKVIAWFALDDVTEANGCMYAVPGSHREGFLPIFHVKGETHHTRLDVRDVNIDDDEVVALTMNAGDVLLFHHLVVHCSRHIAGQTPRRAFRAAYQGFEASTVPRGGPIVIALGDYDKMGQENQDHSYSLPIRLAHALGRRLLRVGQRRARLQG